MILATAKAELLNEEHVLLFRINLPSMAIIFHWRNTSSSSISLWGIIFSLELMTSI